MAQTAELPEEAHKPLAIHDRKVEVWHEHRILVLEVAVRNETAEALD
jgi:hypothetical protein